MKKRKRLVVWINIPRNAKGHRFVRMHGEYYDIKSDCRDAGEEGTPTRFVEAPRRKK